MNSLAILEQQLAPLAPRLNEALAKTMPVSRLIRTIVTAAERLPKLLECDRQSLFNSAMSAAVLGLEVDGVTGQAYLIPFKGKAQLVIGYKGYNTLAARSDVTITGAVVREGDVFDFDKGEGWITHKPVLGSKARIIAAWAKASHNRRPAIVEVMGVDEILAIRAKSPGAQRSDSPWNDNGIGYQAMCEKTVKRRLARSLPLNSMQLAARMDEAVDEQGKSAWITPDRGAVVEGEFKTVGEIEPNPTPTAQDLIGRRADPKEFRGASADGAVAEVPGEVKPAGEPAAVPAIDEGPDLTTLLNQYDPDLMEAVDKGVGALRAFTKGIPRDDRKVLLPEIERTYLPKAKAADAGRVS